MSRGCTPASSVEHLPFRAKSKGNATAFMASDAMRWSPISYDDGVLTPLIVAAALLSTAYGPSFTATDFAELLAVRGQGAALERVTLRNETHAFELQHPSSYDVTARHPLDASYEETFYFQNQSSTLMYLQITDLGKYLPKTNTPNESLYLKSRRQLAGFKSIRVDGKNGYQYCSCGRAACDLNLMFIHRGREYTFVVRIKSDISPASAGFAALTVDQQEIIRSLRFLDEADHPRNRSK